MSKMFETWAYAGKAARVRLMACAILMGAGSIALAVRGQWGALAGAAAGVVVLELAARLFVHVASRATGGLAIDPPPRITDAMVDRFFGHGHDPELGWIRKPGTSKSDLGRYPYVIDSRGSRRNPGHDHLPAAISTYGDSYTFCREVEDHETWQSYLAEQAGTNVLNFGVGNYGLDQALLRLRREWPSNKTDVVIIGIVPQSIGRNLSVWKHYNEFGNLLAFKPRFILEHGRLRLIRNPVDAREKYAGLDNLMPAIQQSDFFYTRRFKGEAFRSPYLASAVANPRAVAMVVAKGVRRLARRIPAIEERLSCLIAERLDTFGVRQTVGLFRDEDALALLEALVLEFAAMARHEGFVPLLALLPMKDDWTYMKRNGHFYERAVDRLRQHLTVVDAAPALLAAGTARDLYREWHYSPRGNQVVAGAIALAFRGVWQGTLGQRRGFSS